MIVRNRRGHIILHSFRITSPRNITFVCSCSCDTNNVITAREVVVEGGRQREFTQLPDKYNGKGRWRRTGNYGGLYRQVWLFFGI